MRIPTKSAGNSEQRQNVRSRARRTEIWPGTLQMDKKEQLEKHEKERRDFLSCLGSAIACGAATVAANSVTSQATAATQETTAASEIPAIPGYDWSKHQWGFGVDAEKCIGCLRLSLIH